MQITEQLKKQGLRLTKPRQELLKVLTNYPLTAQEMHSILQKKSIHIDLVSIYRSLELFVQMGIVQLIDFREDKKRYEMIDKKNHHHHFVCKKCKTIEDVIMNEDRFQKSIKTKSTFKIDSHSLEFFGLCKNCQ